jgi:hypothetical protein
MICRRAFIALLGGLALPVATNAQPAGKKLPRVVLVFNTTPVTEMLGEETPRTRHCS